MKNLKVGLLAAFAVIGLAGCGECQHVDENHDHKCDKCGQVISECKDEEPKDHLCDWCGAKLSEHAAAANSHNCGICGEKLSDCKDDNHDGKCDVCGQEGIPVHHHDDGTGYCSCGAKITVVSVELDTSEAKKTFALGEEFDDEGVVLTATMLDETKKPISFTTSEPDMSTVGEKEITVTYDKLDGTTGTEKYTITVSYWSAADIELQDYALISAAGYLPYIPGMVMNYSVDEFGQLEEMWAELENASLNDLINFNNALNSISFVDQETYPVDVTFKVVPTTVSESVAEAYGLLPESVAASYLIPTFKNSGYTFRAFSVDEYYLIGLTQDGSLKVFIREVSPYIENTVIDYPLEYWVNFDENCLYSFDMGLFDEFFNGKKQSGQIGYDFSECAVGLFEQPGYSGAEDFPLSVYNYQTANPFAKSLDEYGFALSFSYYDARENDRSEYLDRLVELGYELTDTENRGTEENPSLFVTYTLDDFYAGKFEVVISPWYEEFVTYQDGSSQPGFFLDLYYTAPVDYFYKAEEYLIEDVIGLFELEVTDVEFEYPESASDFTVGASFVLEEQTDASAVGTLLASQLATIGQLQQGPSKEVEGVYYFETTDGSFDILVSYSLGEGSVANVKFVVSETIVLPESLEDIAKAAAKAFNCRYGQNPDGSYSVEPIEMNTADPADYEEVLDYVLDKLNLSYLVFYGEQDGGDDYFIRVYETSDQKFTVQLTTYIDEAVIGTGDAMFCDIDIYVTPTYPDRFANSITDTFRNSGTQSGMVAPGVYCTSTVLFPVSDVGADLEKTILYTYCYQYRPTNALLLDQLNFYTSADGKVSLYLISLDGYSEAQAVCFVTTIEEVDYYVIQIYSYVHQPASYEATMKQVLINAGVSSNPVLGRHFYKDLAENMAYAGFTLDTIAADSYNDEYVIGQLEGLSSFAPEGFEKVAGQVDVAGLGGGYYVFFNESTGECIQIQISASPNEKDETKVDIGLTILTWSVAAE